MVSSRKKFGGLFKAQRPKAKLSKTAHQKLRESLKVFDFSSDSESGEDEELVPVRKPVRPKAPPPMKVDTKGNEVKGQENSTIKPKCSTNYRYGGINCVHCTQGNVVIENDGFKRVKGRGVVLPCSSPHRGGEWYYHAPPHMSRGGDGILSVLAKMLYH